MFVRPEPHKKAKIVLLPLDERPCNYDYPQWLPLPKDIDLRLPSRDILSHKKQACDPHRLEDWFLEESKDADYAIISIDALIFGGIVPSRLHHSSEEELLKRAKTIEKCKQANPHIKIYANELIMRCPAYSSSAEEPDYFDRWGREIWEYGALTDQKKQGKITSDGEEHLLSLRKSIPADILDDFIDRRKKNLGLLKQCLIYRKKDIIDFFLIPMDDCSEYGFSSMDRREISAFLEEEGLNEKTLMYPGADEIGMTLLSRALNDFYGFSPKMRLIYASELGKHQIPACEDRPIEKTLPSHVKAAGCALTDKEEEADIDLFVNLGSEFLAKDDPRVEEVYDKDRNLPAFVSQIGASLAKKKVAGIADVAFCNAGDLKLIDELKKQGLLYQVDGYAGWNTSSNTSGTTISELVSYFYSHDEKKKDDFLTERYLEDCLYMAEARDEVNRKVDGLEPDLGINRFELGNKKSELEGLTKKAMERELKRYPPLEKRVADFQVDFFWDRTFEVRLLVQGK